MDILVADVIRGKHVVNKLVSLRNLHLLLERSIELIECASLFNIIDQVPHLLDILIAIVFALTGLIHEDDESRQR